MAYIYTYIYIYPYKPASCYFEIFKDKPRLKGFFMKDCNPYISISQLFHIFFYHFFKKPKPKYSVPAPSVRQPGLAVKSCSIWPWAWRQLSPMAALTLLIFFMTLDLHHDKSSWNVFQPFYHIIWQGFIPAKGKKEERLLNFFLRFVLNTKNITSSQIPRGPNIWKTLSFLVRGHDKIFPLMESAPSFNTGIFLFFIFWWGWKWEHLLWERVC